MWLGLGGGGGLQSRGNDLIFEASFSNLILNFIGPILKKPLAQHQIYWPGASYYILADLLCLDWSGTSLNAEKCQDNRLQHRHLGAQGQLNVSWASGKLGRAGG